MLRLGGRCSETRAVQSQADVAVQASLLLQVSPRGGLLEVWRPEKELQDFSPPCS